MAKKIYIKDNYFYMEDTVTGELTEDFAKNILAKRKNIADDEIVIKGGPEWDQRQALRREELQKVDGSAFVDMDELMAFFEVNTGFSTASGGSGAGSTSELLTDLSGVSSGSTFGYGSYANVSALTTAGFTKLLIQSRGFNASSFDVEASSTIIDLEDVINATRIHSQKTGSTGEIILRTNSESTGGTIQYSGYSAVNVKIYALTEF